MSFNRTFMELKFKELHDTSNRRCRFNRTFMELKFKELHDTSNRRCRFNRTFMELKYQCRNESPWPYYVLIVPLWN